MIAECPGCGRKYIPQVGACICGQRQTQGESELPPLANPLWVRAIRRLRTPEDRGVGDTVARIAAKFGGEKFKRFSKRIGIPCGCTRKQAEWNERWPYDPACIVCGRPATTICSHTLSLGMCGEPLCAGCTHRHVL